MKLRLLGLNKRAVVILGAGASRGASFARRNINIVPPLDKDFFLQLQKIPLSSKQSVIKRFLGFARDEFGNDLNVSMEKFFSQIQFMDTFHSDLQITPGPKITRYRENLKSFSKIILEVFNKAFYVGKEMVRCKYHAKIARDLEPGDAIISFNYDCLADLALKHAAGNKWNAKNGYGFQIQDGCEHWHMHAGRGRPYDTGTIKLLKMHGSLNWNRNGDNVVLRKLPYDIGAARNEGEIIPPVWNKLISKDKVYKKIWKQARTCLRESRILIVIGYSVPETDLMSQALIRVETSEKTKDCIVIVNPNQEDRLKFRKLVSSSIGPNTRIIELETLLDLKKYLA